MGHGSQIIIINTASRVLKRRIIIITCNIQWQQYNNSYHSIWIIINIPVHGDLKFRFEAFWIHGNIMTI